MHKRHECGDVKHTLKQKVYCLCLHSLKIPVAVETPQHTVPICTTGSQQPNSRWPSPVTTAPGQTRREIAVFARHPDNTRTLRLKPKPHSAQRGKRGPWSFVWVLTWMRTQSKGESCSGDREDSAEILIRSDATPGGSNHNKTSISSAIWHKPRTIVNCQTQHGHFCLSSPLQIRTGNTVLRSIIGQVVSAGCTCTEQPIVVVCIMFVLCRD